MLKKKTKQKIISIFNDHYYCKSIFRLYQYILHRGEFTKRSVNWHGGAKCCVSNISGSSLAARTRERDVWSRAASALAHAYVRNSRALYSNDVPLINFAVVDANMNISEIGTRALRNPNAEIPTECGNFSNFLADMANLFWNAILSWSRNNERERFFCQLRYVLMETRQIYWNDEQYKLLLEVVC